MAGEGKAAELGPWVLVTKVWWVPGLWRGTVRPSPAPTSTPCWSRTGRPGARPHHQDEAAMPRPAAAARPKRARWGRREASQPAPTPRGSFGRA